MAGRISRVGSTSRREFLTGIALSGTSAAMGIAIPAPNRGGTLVFSVDAEPPNYDCHGNFSFVVIHPLAPHLCLRRDGFWALVWPQISARNSGIGKSRLTA